MSALPKYQNLSIVVARRLVFGWLFFGGSSLLCLTLCLLLNFLHLSHTDRRGSNRLGDCEHCPETVERKECVRNKPYFDIHP